MRRVVNKILKYPKREVKTLQPYFASKESYSQCGEDLLIQYIFRLRGVEYPSYIDVGANHPFYLNNTAIFYEKGCRGINIEANPGLIDHFQIHRSEDKNLNVGIGPVEADLDFYIMNDPTLSTFSAHESDRIITSGKHWITEVRKVNVITIEEVLETYWSGAFPDFLSIDVEGLDFEILQTINFSKHSPKVICVEAAEYSPTGAGKRKNELIDFLVEKGYYEYANTNLNAIMVKREFWFI